MSDDVQGWLSAQGTGVLSYLLDVVRGKQQATGAQLQAAKILLDRAYDKPPVSSVGGADGDGLLRGARDKLAKLIEALTGPDPSPPDYVPGVRLDSMTALGLAERSPRPPIDRLAPEAECETVARPKVVPPEEPKFLRAGKSVVEAEGSPFEPGGDADRLAEWNRAQRLYSDREPSTPVSDTQYFPWK